MTNSKEEKSQQPKKNKKNPKYLLVFTLFMLSVIALIIPFYTLEISRIITQQKTYVNDQLLEFKQQQALILSHLDKINQDLTGKEKNIQDRFETVNQKIRLSLQEHGKAPIDWKLYKAHYYLELAQLNAYWSGDDINTTIALLEQTDTLLSKFSDQKIITLRQDIAKEISQLKSYPGVDTTGLLNKLDAAQNIVNQLAIPQPEFKPEIDANQKQDSTEATKKSAWQQHLSSSIDILKKLVVVHKNTDSIKPLLSPLYSTTIREIINLNLQQAQRAVLRKNEQIFQISIQQAINNIQSSFNKPEQATQDLLKNLKDIKEINLTPPKTNIQQLLGLLNEIINNLSFLHQNNEVKTTGDN